MSMQRPSSLSVYYVDPESEPVTEPEPAPEPAPEPPKRKGRPPGTKNKSKTTKRNIPWYRIVRSLGWWAVATLSVLSLYWGVQGWLGQSAAYITLSVSVVVAAFLLDRDGKKMRETK